MAKKSPKKRFPWLLLIVLIATAIGFWGVPLWTGPAPLEPVFESPT